jgi:hypothetical protein
MTDRNQSPCEEAKIAAMGICGCPEKTIVYEHLKRTSLFHAEISRCAVFDPDVFVATTLC